MLFVGVLADKPLFFNFGLPLFLAMASTQVSAFPNDTQCLHGLATSQAKCAFLQLEHALVTCVFLLGFNGSCAFLPSSVLPVGF